MLIHPGSAAVEDGQDSGAALENLDHFLGSGGDQFRGIDARFGQPERGPVLAPVCRGGQRFEKGIHLGKSALPEEGGKTGDAAGAQPGHFHPMPFKKRIGLAVAAAHMRGNKS